MEDSNSLVLPNMRIEDSSGKTTDLDYDANGLGVTPIRIKESEKLEITMLSMGTVLDPLAPPTTSVTEPTSGTAESSDVTTTETRLDGTIITTRTVVNDDGLTDRVT